eukprot:TRINITY_DN32143_c0_g1_i1.p1 TRINITY_DN32143_c0_g1~~TRINITY_DN32143_c0_g1_i1.p1  ORF type:complete len:946 (+),score=118.02 TRINITY_DN32143_c0_g1_i1:261-2840(+)
MACYCEPNQAKKTCRFRKDGHRGRIPTRTKFLYSFPAFAWQAMNWQKSAHQKKFYIDDQPQANLGICTLFLVLAVLIDAFTDPKMAVLTDNCSSRFGRRRPFIALSAFFCPLMFLLSWTPMVVKPGFQSALWFGVLHVGTKLADTLFNIPHEALGASMTTISQERTSCWMWRDLFGNVGILFGLAVMPMLMHDGAECASTPGEGCVVMPQICAIFGFLFMCGCLALAFFGREPTLWYLNVLKVYSESGSAHLLQQAKVGGPLPEDPLKAMKARAPGPLSKFSDEDTIPSIMSCVLNRLFRTVLVSVFTKGAGVNVPFTLLPFMVTWVIGEKCMGPTLYTFCGAVVLVAGLVTVVPWGWTASRFGKYKAFLGYNVGILVTSTLFFFVTMDSGDCFMTYFAIGVCFIWGGAYGGSFLQSDLVCDSIDYDEFLTGGRRREGAYMMAVEFIPKFVTIPGDSIPLMLMARYHYHRPTIAEFRPSCAKGNVTSWASPDMFCHHHYTTEPQNASWCSSTYTCAELMADGVKFVCNDAAEQCGMVQNSEIQTLLRMCFSLVPAFFVLIGIWALLHYPKEARYEEAHEQLLAAITAVRRNERTEDPYFPGNFVKRMDDVGPNVGALSYFWPSELRNSLTTSQTCASSAAAAGARDTSSASGAVIYGDSAVGDDGDVDAINGGATPNGDSAIIPPAVPPSELPALNVAVLLKWPVASLVVALALIPVGALIMVAGYDDLVADSGGSVTPIGLMLIGVGILIVWWEGTRLQVALAIRRHGIKREEVVAYLDFMAPFEGRTSFEEEGATSPEASVAQETTLQPMPVLPTPTKASGKAQSEPPPQCWNEEDEEGFFEGNDEAGPVMGTVRSI